MSHLGLIASDWAGAPIESWSSPEALASCRVDNEFATPLDNGCNSCAWNAMINPLKRTSLTRFILYGFEENLIHNRDLFGCTFPALVASWRSEFSANSGTAPDAPFGFVQLSTGSTRSAPRKCAK